MSLYKAPRGTRDILPEDQPHWRLVEERIHRICQLYGYRKINIPIFEETSLFERGVGEGTDIVEKEMYSFIDKGGTELTLRPEFTAGVVRAYLEHGMHVLPQPVKLYSIGPAFRYDRPQAGRYRQFHQFNVEAIGVQDPALDVEVMSLAKQFYEELGFKELSFQINSIGCPRCRPRYLKVLVEYYEQHLDEICDDCRRRLKRNPLRVLDCKNEACQPIIAGAPPILDHLCQECREHFDALRRYLDLLGWPYTINPRLVRGLDYYTKTVFEVWAEGIGAQSALCGGGRYDGLAEELGGNPTPGVGFAAGLDRTILAMRKQGIEVPSLPAPQVSLAYLGQEAKEAALRLLASLREAGISVACAFGERSL
ncbi:MAG: histidine--tRNA ligase, partial [Chloroflexota bacterium]|nr:histidine--tRNA ligase [Chloroflexota bacterium]